MEMLQLFRRLIHAQVVLGVVAYGVAERNAAMVLMAGTFGTLSWYVVEGPGGKPLPRWLINSGVLVAVAWLYYNQLSRHQELIHGLGQFILAIQILKLYERKTNRDYAQLLVLSLMQMICASIISASMLYGTVLVIYLTVALLTALLFHLKRSYDEVTEAQRSQAPAGWEAVRPRPIAGPGYRRQFRGMAMVCGLVALGVSLVVFVAVPRGGGMQMLEDLESAAQRQTSGYDDEVRLSGGMSVGSSDRPVMNVRISRGGRDLGSPNRGFLLRGSALDEYNPQDGEWQRSSDVASLDRTIDLDRDEKSERIRLEPEAAGARAPLVQRVTLRSHTAGALFAAYAPRELTVDGKQLKEVRLNRADHALLGRERDSENVSYTVKSSRAATDRRRFWPGYARGRVLYSERVQQLTRSVLEQNGLQRDPSTDTASNDGAIAGAVEQYLRENFTYTLDLPRVPLGVDPIIAFLFENRKGHCEYFASAMCAMLRSIGVRCRVITGFRASEYNTVGGYYVVRQKNAHAWVEVWTENGWRTYDPSPPANIEQIHRSPEGLAAVLRNIYDFIEFQWIAKVVTYDTTQQEKIFERVGDMFATVNDTVKRAAEATASWLRSVRDHWVFGPLGLALVGFLVVVIAFGLLLLVQTVVRHRRSVRQLQLHDVPKREQKRLATHLEFYLQMLRMLQRAGHHKPGWQPPAAFAERLLRRDPQRFTDVRPLTELFYEIRFGHRPMDKERARRVQYHLDRLRQSV